MSRKSDPGSAESSSTAERLVAIAGEIFAVKGMAATVREICAKAGCSIAAINYHFGDKQHLFTHCVQLACQRKKLLFPLPQFDQDGLAPQEMLRLFVRAIARRVQGVSDSPWQDTLMLREILTPSAETGDVLRQSIRPDFEQLQALLSTLLGPELDTPELRSSMATQILARSMFLRTGKNLRCMLGLDSPANEDPMLYADALCDSILTQVTALRDQTLLRDSIEQSTHAFPKLAPQVHS